MFQHGQVFKLKTRGSNGQPLWAYRYRVEGRGWERPQVGGFATREEVEKALRKVLDRLGPGGGRRAALTLAEFVVDSVLVIQSMTAMPALERPCAISASTSRSRGDRSLCVEPQRAR